MLISAACGDPPPHHVGIDSVPGVAASLNAVQGQPRALLAHRVSGAWARRFEPASVARALPRPDPRRPAISQAKDPTICSCLHSGAL
eukprot:5411480-Pyramimonas_sp.AAC.1